MEHAVIYLNKHTMKINEVNLMKTERNNHLYLRIETFKETDNAGE